MAQSNRSLQQHQTLTLSLLFLAGIVNFLDRSSLSVANTTLRAEMHLSATQIGLLLSAFSLAYGFTQIPLMGLLGRTSTRYTLGAGLALWSTAQMATAFARTFSPFVLLRVSLGMGEAPFFPAGVQSIRDWFSAEGRGRATAAMNMSSTLGLAVAPPLLTALMLRTGWRTMFFLLGAAGILLSALWLLLHRARRDTPFALPVTTSASTKGWSHLLRHRTVWGMMLGFAGINYTGWLYLAWLPGYLQNARHLSLTSSGWLAAIPFLAGSLGMLCSGSLADELAKRGVSLMTLHRGILLAGMTGSAGCTYLVAHAVTTGSAVALISMALFLIHFAGTSGWGLTQAVAPPNEAGTLSALQNFSSFTIASVGPILTGWLLDRTHSFALALSICSMVTLLGAASYLCLARETNLES